MIKPGTFRPFFPFYGSKWNIARHYPSPRDGLVIEPFAGGAGYATFYGCPNVILVDADPYIAGLWSYLIGVTAEEIMALPELPNIGDCVDDFELPQEAKWLIGFWLNRGSASPKKTRTAYSARTDRGQLNWGLKAKQRIAAQLPLLAGWKVQSGSFDTAPDVAATWFIDPPYGDKGRFYRIQFAEFERLGQWALQRQGLAITCEGPGAEWLPFEPLGSFKSSKGRAQEFVHVSQDGANSMTEAVGAPLTAGAMFFEAKAAAAGHENERVFASEIAEAIRSVIPNPSAITAPSACQEMLEALKEGEPYVEAFHSLMSQKEAREPVMDVLRRMRAAIAKAEGSSQP